MGSRGPVPHRSEDLSRDRDANRGGRPDITKGKARPVVWPQPDENWHDIARMLWDACQLSGQADFYQQSDIALLYSLCDDLSHFKDSHKRSGQMLQTIMSSFERLLVAEGDRRRVRVELEVESAEDDGIADYMEDDGPGLRLVS